MVTWLYFATCYDIGGDASLNGVELLTNLVR